MVQLSHSTSSFLNHLISVTRLRVRRRLGAVVALMQMGFHFSTQMVGAESIDPLKIETAIQRVYPALVQIHVVTPNYQRGREAKFEAAGSGVIISEDGYVVTNHHVAGKATAIHCILSSKAELDATLVGTDAMSDIAILKLDPKLLPKGVVFPKPATFGSSRHLQVGEPVLAMGCPLALSQSVTLGIIANKDMIMPKMFDSDFTLDGEDVGSLVKWIGHDAQIQPGNSGGPLVNIQGEIIGINEIGLGQMSGAIPADLVQHVFNEIIQHGNVRRSWIGASFQPILKSDPTVVAGTPSGVLVASVLKDSPAGKAGLQEGDVITDVDGEHVVVQYREQLPSFHMMLFSKPIGSDLKLNVRRDGKEVALNVKTELRDSAEGDQEEAKEWGLVVENLTEWTARRLYRKNKEGVIIRSIRSGGPSDKAVPAMNPDDVIVKVAGTTVMDKNSFFKITSEIVRNKKEPVRTLVVFERNDEQFIAIVEVGIRPPRDPIPEAERSWIPVETQVLSRKLASAMGMPKSKGVRVTRVYEDLLGRNANLKTGDIITQIDGRPVEASDQGDEEIFSTMIRLYPVGSKVELGIRREDKDLKVPVVLVEEPKPEKELKVYEDVQIEFRGRDISYFDRVRNHWDKDIMGVMVNQVEQGGWADIGGLKEGDLIQEVDHVIIKNASELEGALKKNYQANSRSVVLKVQRGLGAIFVEIEPQQASTKKNTGGKKNGGDK